MAAWEETGVVAKLQQRGGRKGGAGAVTRKGSSKGSDGASSYCCADPIGRGRERNENEMGVRSLFNLNSPIKITIIPPNKNIHHLKFICHQNTCNK